MTTPFYFAPLRALAITGILAFSALSLSAAEAVTPIPYKGLTPEDTAKLDASLKKQLIAQAPETKAVFDAHPTFKLVQVNSAIVPAPFNPTKHAANVARAKQGDVDLLFLGDSITDFWQTTGKNEYAEYFGSVKVADFAISGDKTQGVLYRLQDGEGQGISPKAVMLMIGTNNISLGNSATEIVDGIIADINEIRKDFPAAKILLLGIFPRSTPENPQRNVIKDINATISKLDDGKNIFYCDIGPKFLNADGTFISGTFLPGDGYLHPTAAGYKIWGEAVKDTLASLMKGETPPPMK